MKNRPSFESNPWLSHDAGPNPSFIRALKDRIDEDADYEQQISFYKKNYPSVYDLQFLQQNMFVIPVTFSKEHMHRLAHSKEMMEYQNGYVAIHPRYNNDIFTINHCNAKETVVC
jgi:hypothetical protein